MRTRKIIYTDKNGNKHELLLPIIMQSCTTHTSDKWVISKPPTCTEAGERIGNCLYCGITLNEEIAALGHDLSEWVFDEATQKERKTCTRCGYFEEQEPKFVYTYLKESDSYSVRAGDGLSGDIVIPSTYNGKAVTEIESHGFDNQDSIETVIIPEGVKHIGDYAFAYIDNLKEIVIPKSATYVGKFVVFFSGVKTVYYGGTEDEWNSLDKSEYPNSINNPTRYYYSEEEPTDDGNYWHWVDGKPEVWSFAKYFDYVEQDDGTWSVTLKSDIDIPNEIEIPSQYNGRYVTTIGDNAFYQRDTVVSVKIPYTITSIGMNAFDGCSNLKDVYITDVEAWLNIEFSDEHDTYYAHPNIYGTLHILDKNDNEITEVVVPSSITQIKDCAFRNATNLTHITLHDKVKRIEWGAFKNCSSLQEFTIPDSVEYIGHQTLNGCSSIVSIVLPYIGNFDWKNENHFYEYPLGYHFGTEEYEGGVATEQEYYNFWDINDPGTLLETRTFYIPEGLRIVEVHRGNILHGAFQNCTGITKVTLPTEIDKIGKNSFLNCENLEELIIPVTLQEIDYSAFEGCSKVIIQYYGDTTKYRIENNCLVEVLEDGTEEVIFGNQNSEIPSTASSVGAGAFYGNTYFAPIKIPLSVTDIGSLAFGGKPVTVYVPYKQDEIPSGWADDWCDDSVTVIWGYREDEECSHEYGGWTTTVVPTCTKFGSMQRTCSRCGNVEITPIEPLGHNYVPTSVTEPTCEDEGYTTYTCTRCGDSYKGDFVPNNGHDMDGWVVVTQPTCTTEGLKRATCQACGLVEEQTIPPIAGAHNYKLHENVAATCTEQGYVTMKCSICGHEDTEYKAALGHAWGDWEDVHPAECEIDGTQERTCARCGEVETRNIPATGHDWDTEVEVVPPNCTDGGYTIHTCNACGTTHRDNYTEPLGHDWDKWVTTQQPTCESEGVFERVCKRCGEKESEPINALGHVLIPPTCTTPATCGRCGATEGEPLGHTPSDWIIDVEPTTETEGSKHKECTRCGVILETATIPKLVTYLVTESGEFLTDEQGNKLIL